MSDTCFGLAVSLAAIVVGGSAISGYAQPSTPPASPIPFPACARPPSPCPSPPSGPLVVGVNVEFNGTTCAFEPRTVEKLKHTSAPALIGNSSTCPFETTIELRATNGPFDNFRIFHPRRDNANVVKVTMPCNDKAYAWGTDAQEALGRLEVRHLP